MLIKTKIQRNISITNIEYRSFESDFPDFIFFDHKVFSSWESGLWVSILVNVLVILISMTNICIWWEINVWVFDNTNIKSSSKSGAWHCIIENCFISFAFFECELVVIVELKNERFSAFVGTPLASWIPSAGSESADDFSSTCFDDCQCVWNFIGFCVKLHSFKRVSWRSEEQLSRKDLFGEEINHLLNIFLSFEDIWLSEINWIFIKQIIVDRFF